MNVRDNVFSDRIVVKYQEILTTKRVVVKYTRYFIHERMVAVTRDSDY